MNPENQKWVSAEEMLEQTRRNRCRAAMLESRSEPVLPEDALKKVTSPKNSKVAKSITKI